MLSAALALVSGPALAQSDGSKSNRRAIAHYADAAAYQNNAAYELAIEEWQKLLADYPSDPLSSKAWHYLGVCYIQLDKPDYKKASAAFTRALKDPKLEVREESLVNLSWCLFTEAREAEPGSAAQKTGLTIARDRLKEFLADFSDGGYVDQALFYLGEIEYLLGNSRQSIRYYKMLLDSRKLAKSSLRPDARYALAVAYEEEKSTSEAARQYKQFLSEHASHRLAAEVRVRLSDLLLAQNKSAEAAELLSQLVSGDAGEMNDYALLRLGYASAQQGKSTEATRYYRQLLQQYPNSKHAPTAALSLGQSLFQSGQYDDAIKQFRMALPAKDEQAAGAAHWMATTYLRQDKPKQALEVIEDALQWTKPGASLVALQMDYADALYAIPGQLTKARAAYELIAKDHPQDPLAPRAAYNAAFAELQSGRFEQAQSWAEKFLQRYPQDPLRNDVAYVAAEALLQQGEHDGAVAAYRKLRSADPNNESASLWALRLGMAHYLGGDYRQATELLQAELRNFKDAEQKAEAQFIVGASLLYQEQPARAIELLTSSHRTSDRWNSADEVLLMLAEAYQQNQDDAAAKRTLESLLKKYPRTRLKAQVDYKLAQLSAAVGEFDTAIAKYESIVRNDEATNYHGFAHYGIAWCLMQQEKYDTALTRLRPLLRRGTRDSITLEAQLAEGVCLRKIGRTDDAVRSLQRFLATSPTGTSLANGLYELGLAYTEKGDLVQANQQFERVLRQAPDYAAKDRVLYELAWNYSEGTEKQKSAQYFADLANDFPRSEFAAEAVYMVAQHQYEAENYSLAARTYARVMERTDDPDLREKAQYKLGWSLFQQESYAEAQKQFADQARAFPRGRLAVDGLFMQAECSFKQDRFDTALSGYKQARSILESNAQSSATEQVKTLVYLHGAQCLRERERWQECQQWLEVIVRRFPESPYLATALYELGFCKQNQNKPQEALAHYAEVANNYRNEVGARARFMMGEVYFEQRDFVSAIPEFQRVMYGFGGDRATEEIKNWQVKSAFEAARCSEVLIQNLQGEGREKIIKAAQDYYRFIVEKHAAHDLAAQAQNRLGELQKIR